MSFRHIDLMAKKSPRDEARAKRLKDLRDLLGFESQTALANALKRHLPSGQLSRGAVGNWEQGKDVGLDGARALVAVALERGHEVTIDWIVSGQGHGPAPATNSIYVVPVHAAESNGGGTRPEVKLVGYVGAGQEAHYYALAQDELDTVPAPEGAGSETVAVEVRGSSLGALFDRWLVFYDDVRAPVSTDQIGTLCVVGLPDDRVLIKKLRVSKLGNELYDLLSNTEDPILGQPVMWAAKVKSMVPR